MFYRRPVAKSPVVEEPRAGALAADGAADVSGGLREHVLAAPAALAALSASAPSTAPSVFADAPAPSVTVRREARPRTPVCDNGLNQLVGAIEELAALEERLELMEQDVTHGDALGLARLPSATDVGVNEFEPRLAEAALLIAALTRRMNLRLGAVEQALEGQMADLQAATSASTDRSQTSMKPAAARKPQAAKQAAKKKTPVKKRAVAKKPPVAKKTVVAKKAVAKKTPEDKSGAKPAAKPEAKPDATANTKPNAKDTKTPPAEKDQQAAA